MDNEIMWNNDAPVADLGIDFPEWIDSDITPADVAAIVQGGCASGAYMPAVTYHTAAETMAEHGDDVLDYLQNVTGELPQPASTESWLGMAVHYLSAAVELWAMQVEGEIVEALEAAETETEEQREEELETLAAQWPEVRSMVVEQYGEDDEIALNEAFNDWTDSLCNDGTISEWTYNNVCRDDVE